jgi:chitinase
MRAVGGQDRTPGNPTDKQNFIKLIRELHNAFKPHGFVLSAATSAGKSTIDKAYNLTEMNKYLDMINLMTYDFHGAWESKTGSTIILFSIFSSYSKYEL